ncbi:porin [Aliivibrio sp. S2TY2]|uniref:porin n=1 Tax=unclassified Aliivibrio TaxID=2645654 RepID=UPI002378874B|nr:MULTISPECIES: porin [unclassified Aliivibrio]MDD9174526.1 porin [Aliivibrio sp. S3TY1]MDD9191605.1 porin [Aliivibrio sp. S2TY2]
MENKFFKTTLLGAAVALASSGVTAKEVGINSDFSVDVYGVAAMSAVNYNTTGNGDGTDGYVLENESRIGFRAHKEMFENVLVTMQIESGYVDSWQGGELGARDTYLGLSGDWGNLRAGRVLTPMYEIIDWPFSNPGLGSVFDWGGVNGHYDRQSNQVRYDSPSFGGLTFAVSAGRDGNPSGSATRDSRFFGGNVKYTINTVTLMGAVEGGSDFRGVSGNDNLSYLVGAEVGLPGGFSLAAAYKQETVDIYTRDADADTGDAGAVGENVEQGSFSIIGQYWADSLGFKLGYAANLDAKGIKTNGSAAEETLDSNTISGQVMYVHNGFVPYVRVAGRTVGDADTDIVTRVGLEYGF